jgi:hypothetical protein
LTVGGRPGDDGATAASRHRRDGRRRRRTGGLSEAVELPDIRVYDESGRELTATFGVTEVSSGETVLDETRTLPVRTRGAPAVAFQNPVTSAGTHTVSVAVEDGSDDTHDWDVQDDGDGNQDEAYSLRIDIGEGTVDFTLWLRSVGRRTRIETDSQGRVSSTACSNSRAASRTGLSALRV